MILLHTYYHILSGIVMTTFAKISIGGKFKRYCRKALIRIDSKISLVTNLSISVFLGNLKFDFKNINIFGTFQT